ncbi:hypothetical protein GA0115261_104081 [Streptomyces sp. OspMP-M43]|nr:hypothetical protein GA0115261_104081 [Streptomyces sp. OspMP-M43]
MFCGCVEIGNLHHPCLVWRGANGAASNRKHETRSLRLFLGDAELTSTKGVHVLTAVIAVSGPLLRAVTGRRIRGNSTTSSCGGSPGGSVRRGTCPGRCRTRLGQRHRLQGGPLLDLGGLQEHPPRPRWRRPGCARRPPAAPQAIAGAAWRINATRQYVRSLATSQTRRCWQRPGLRTVALRGFRHHTGAGAESTFLLLYGRGRACHVKAGHRLLPCLPPCSLVRHPQQWVPSWGDVPLLPRSPHAWQHMAPDPSPGPTSPGRGRHSGR